MSAPLPRRLLAEYLGSAFLAALVVGSGIAAQHLSSDNGLRLLENAAVHANASWRRRAFCRARDAAGITSGRPYDLRHSFASLLLHEGRNVIYVARQLGHDARLTLTRYGHVMDEYEDQPNLAAEDAIAGARESLRTRHVPTEVAAAG